MAQLPGLIGVDTTDVSSAIPELMSRLGDPSGTDDEVAYELLWLLGCPRNGTADTMGGPLSRPDYRAHGEQIGAALITINAIVASTSEHPAWCQVASILVGLARASIWRRCLLRESTTYELAATTLTYIQEFTNVASLDLFTEPFVCSFLNTWLQPSVEWINLPSADVVAEHLFGPAWCAIQCPNLEQSLGRISYLTRPPFQPGICPAQVTTTAVRLPDDVSFPA
jgi:hypothetical protein